MFAQVSCGNCNFVIKADDKFFGKTVKCPNCKAHLKIPDPRVQQAISVDPLIGKQIAQYQIEALLGEGGMGKVYRARNTKLDKTCALKVLPESFVKQDKSRVDRFVLEAKSAANVEHPNVLPVQNVGNEGNTYYIEMQYVDGGTLDNVLEQKGRLDPNEAARIVRDVAAGLSAAHAKGIIHRDIKPSNVMLTSDGQVKVADFGLARMGEMTTKLTMSGMILGTPLYMSPEQSEGKSVDHRSDIYSLGIMFYQLLTGNPPFTADTPVAILRHHLDTPLPDISQVIPDFPALLAAILSRMTAKKPEERYQNCVELFNDLNGYLMSAAQGQGAVGISESTMLKAQELKRAIRGGQKKKSMAPVLIGVIPTLIVVGILAFVLVPKWKRQMEHPSEPQVEKVVKKTYTYKGTEYTAEQLLAIGIDPKTGKAIKGQESEVRSQKPEGKAENVIARGAESALRQSHEIATAQQAGPRDGKTGEKKATTDEHRLTQIGEKKETEDRSRKPEEKPVQSQIANRQSKIDLVAYLDDIKPVDERIAAMDYPAARSRLNLLSEKYPGLAKTKLENMDRIVALRKRCIERVNSGAVKLGMGDVSKRYAFAGAITKADESGLHAKIKKTWDSFNREELTEFYRKSSDPKNPDDVLGIAAFLMEGAGDDAGLDAALDPLGKAKGLGADVSGLLTYVETLKQAKKEYAEATAKGKALETADATTKDTKGTKEETEIQNQQSKIQNDFDGVYVTEAATRDKIPHPLSRKTYTIRVGGKKIEVPEGMVYVPAGKSLMGNNENSKYTGFIQKEVYLDGYFIDKYEVSNVQYKAFVDATGRQAPQHWAGGKISEGRENHPVVYVNWEDAKAYCDWCGKRLPTEAEWEKAAAWDVRQKRHREYPWGDDYSPQNANHCYQLGCRCDGDPKVHTEWFNKWSKTEEAKKLVSLGGNTVPVGQFKGDCSFFMCFDMAGNVREWLEDWHQEDYYKVGPAKNPTGPSEAEAPESAIYRAKCRAWRGSSWDCHKTILTNELRHEYLPTHKSNALGFRCALSAADLGKWKSEGRSLKDEGEQEKAGERSQKPEARDQKSSVDSVPSVVGKTITVRQDGKGDFKTIQEAIDAANDGDTIHIADTAIYTQPTIDGTKKKSITLRGTITKKGMTTLRWDQVGSGIAVEILRPGRDWQIVSLVLENVSPEARVYAIRADPAGNCSVRDCFFRKFELSTAISLSRLERALVENSVFTDCVGAVVLQAECDGAKLQFVHNIVQDCVNGIAYYETGVKVTLAVNGNVFAGIKGKLLRLLGAVPKPCGVESNSNCFHRIGMFRRADKEEAEGAYGVPTLKEWQKVTQQDKHSIEADPMFVNPEKGDFRLQRGSPCRGRGPKKDGKRTDIGVDWDEFFGKQ